MSVGIHIEKEDKSKLKHEIFTLTRSNVYVLAQVGLNYSANTYLFNFLESKSTHAHFFLSNQVLLVKLVIRVVLELQKK